MSVSEFELIILENGDIGLQQVGEGELLVRVNFSAEVKRYLGEQQVEVAKHMINSGINAVIEMEQSDVISLEQERDITVH